MAVSESWFFQHRQDWIAEAIRIFGFINRVHLERKFEISTAQASLDIRHFMERNPEALTYNKTAKRYETSGPTEPETEDQIIAAADAIRSKAFVDAETRWAETPPDKRTRPWPRCQNFTCNRTLTCQTNNCRGFDF